MKTEITVTEALATLKLLDKRIQKHIKQGIVGYKVGSNIQKEFSEKDVKENWQALQDLIVRRNDMKMAINISNVNTKISISNKKMTVLEAIEFRKTIEYKKDILKNITRNFGNIQDIIEYGNNETKERLDSQVKAAFEKASGKDIKDFTETFNKNNQYSMVDPLNIENLHAKLDEEIDGFENEIDFVLSTSNATTTIKV